MTARKSNSSTAGTGQEKNELDTWQSDAIRAAALYQETELSLEQHNLLLRNLKQDISIQTSLICRLENEVKELNKEETIEAKDKAESVIANNAITAAMRRLVQDVDGVNKRFFKSQTDVEAGEITFKKGQIQMRRNLEDRQKTSHKLNSAIGLAEALPKLRHEKTQAMNEQEDNLMAEFEELSIQTTNTKQTLENEIILLERCVAELEERWSGKQTELTEMNEKMGLLKTTIETCSCEVEALGKELDTIDPKISECNDRLNQLTPEDDLVTELETGRARWEEGKEALDEWVREDERERESIHLQIVQLTHKREQLQQALSASPITMDAAPNEDVPPVIDGTETKVVVGTIPSEDAELHTDHDPAPDQIVENTTEPDTVDEVRQKMELLAQQNEQLHREMNEMKKQQLELRGRSKTQSLVTPEPKIKQAPEEIRKTQKTVIEKKRPEVCSRLFTEPSPTYMQSDQPIDYEDFVRDLETQTQNCKPKKGRSAAEQTKAKGSRKRTEKKQAQTNPRPRPKKDTVKCKEVCRKSKVVADMFDDIISPIRAISPWNTPGDIPLGTRSQGRPLANSTPMNTPVNDVVDDDVQIIPDEILGCQKKSVTQVPPPPPPQPKRFFLSRVQPSVQKVAWPMETRPGPPPLKKKKCYGKDAKKSLFLGSFQDDDDPYAFH